MPIVSILFVIPILIYLFPFLIILLPFIIILLLTQNTRTIPHKIKKVRKRNLNPYSQKKRASTKKSFFSKSEKAFYLELKRQLNTAKYHILAKPRLIDVIEQKEDRDPIKYELMRKHLDFIILDYNFKPILAIEVDGWSHNLKHVSKNDSFKNEVFTMVDMPLVRVQVGQNFTNIIKAIIIKYKLY